MGLGPEEGLPLKGLRQGKSCHGNTVRRLLYLQTSGSSAWACQLFDTDSHTAISVLVPISVPGGRHWRVSRLKCVIEVEPYSEKLGDAARYPLARQQAKLAIEQWTRIGAAGPPPHSSQFEPQPIAHQQPTSPKTDRIGQPFQPKAASLIVLFFIVFARWSIGRYLGARCDFIPPCAFLPVASGSRHYIISHITRPLLTQQAQPGTVHQPLAALFRHWNPTDLQHRQTPACPQFPCWMIGIYHSFILPSNNCADVYQSTT